jgi:hypothetical protein
MNDNATNPVQELDAMKTIAEALTTLDAEATRRVIWWAAERFGVAVVAQRALDQQRPPFSEGDPGRVGGAGSPGKFEHLADLYSAVSPKTDAERALVAGYWFQYIEGTGEFGSQTINTALKDLGNGVSNITNAFDALKSQKPQLVVQLKKSGTSKQARKTYKLTVAGKNAIEAMISSED